MLKPGELVAWVSAGGRSVVLQRTDAGQTWTVEYRTTAGIQTFLESYPTEEEGRHKARCLAQFIKNAEAN